MGVSYFCLSCYSYLCVGVYAGDYSGGWSAYCVKKIVLGSWSKNVVAFGLVLREPRWLLKFCFRGQLLQRNMPTSHTHNHQHTLQHTNRNSTTSKNNLCSHSQNTKKHEKKRLSNHKQKGS